MLYSIFGEKDKRPKQGLMKERDFKEAHYEEVDAFIDRVHIWPELWQLDGKTSFFIFREFIRVS
jgi:hypothetical protein